MLWCREELTIIAPHQWTRSASAYATAVATRAAAVGSGCLGFRQNERLRTLCVNRPMPYPRRAKRPSVQRSTVLLAVLICSRVPRCSCRFVCRPLDRPCHPVQDQREASLLQPMVSALGERRKLRSCWPTCDDTYANAITRYVCFRRCCTKTLRKTKALTWPVLGPYLTNPSSATSR